MIKTKVAFLEGRLFSSQSEQFEKFSKSSDWLEKGRPSKKATFVLINRVIAAHKSAIYMSIAASIINFTHWRCMNSMKFDLAQKYNYT